MRAGGGRRFCLRKLAATTETHDYAVGAKDQVVAPYPCTLRDAAPVGSITAEQWASNAWGIAPVVFTAHTPGVARFACEHTTFIVRAHTPVRVALKSPTRVAVGERFTPTLTGIAADGTALELGRYAMIDWTFEGAIRTDNPGRCEFPPWCGSAPAGATWAVGSAPGAGRMTGTFAGLAATAAVDVMAGDL